MTIPNFFMPGAPKGGTTAMARYLSEHPDVFISTPKEPAYFGRRLLVRKSDQARGHHNDLRSYLSLFEAAEPHHLIVGEASTTYLFDPVAIGEIASFAPTAKIVVMLRNPVDLVYALHSELCRSANETEQDFRAAWGLQQARSQGRSIPRSTRRPATLQYGTVGLLGEQVERVLEHFPREQVQLILFDDLQKDAGQTYRSVLGFLGLPDDRRTAFDVVNPHKNLEQTRLMRWLKSDTVLRQLSQQAKRATGRGSWGIYERLIRHGSVIAPTPPLGAEMRRELTEFFHSDVMRLEKILDRDLSHWRRLPEATG